MIPRVKPGHILKVSWTKKSGSLKAFLDTNIFIYAMEMNPIHGEAAARVIEKVDRGDIEGVTSSIVVLEVCWYLESRNRLLEMREAVNLILGSKIRVEDSRMDDVLQAVTYKGSHSGVDLNDLINYCIMKRLGLETVYTNDSHFKGLPGLRILFN